MKYMNLVISQYAKMNSGGSRDIYSGHSPKEEFEGGLHEKRKGKGVKRRKRKRVIKHTLNTFMKLK